MPNHKTGCLICGKPLVYLDEPESSFCMICKKEFSINEQCEDGHYICNNCHSMNAMDVIREYCINTNQKDPVEMATTLMKHPSVKMHGPEHHLLVPAVLLASYYNIKGDQASKEKKIRKSRTRAENILGGFCGTHGNCGAGVGTGIFVSLITDSTPLSEKGWSLSNMMTAKSLFSIAEKGGPRCCKRDSYTALTEAALFVKENFKVDIPVTKNIKCEFSNLNKECLKNKCMYYKNEEKEFSLSDEDIKKAVKEKYGQISKNAMAPETSSCCGCSCFDLDYSVFNDDYKNQEGYNPDADLGLGCGIPTEYAGIKKGDMVIDLGSGAGNDCFVAHALTGESGRVIGIDMTEEMIEKARLNNSKLGFKNIEFRLGEIENLPVEDNIADVVISNCVINLVPNKNKAFSEIFRVLKTGGHFSISDVVLNGQLPASLKSAAEMYAGCVSGALQKSDYIDVIKNSGFINVKIVKEKQVIIPDEILLRYISKEETEMLKDSGLGIFSVTVFGEKPA